jgi:hypothetical protein
MPSDPASSVGIVGTIAGLFSFLVSAGGHHREVQQLQKLREQVEGIQPFSGNNVSGVTSSLTCDITPQNAKLARYAANNHVHIPLHNDFASDAYAP